MRKPVLAAVGLLFGLVSFAQAGIVVDELYGYLPVAGSVLGLSGSNFKTSVQILNAGFSPLTGHFVFHPAGVSANPSDPVLDFSLDTGATFAWEDIVGTMGRSGVGSIDVFASSGATLVVLTRIYNDAGAAGTSGFTEPLVKPTDVSGGLGVSVTGFLICPFDTARFRYNVGVRTLDAPVSVTVTIVDASGAIVGSTTHDYGPNFFAQTDVAAFAGAPILGGDSLRITFSGGGVIIYGATIDNTTNDPSAQFMPYLFAIA